MTRLFVQYYQIPDSGILYDRARGQARQAELDACLQRNLEAPELDEVVVVIEKEVKSKLLEHPKVHLVQFERRPTFQDFFQLMRERGEEGDLLLLANSDICFDDSLDHLKEISLASQCLALSRWDVLENGELKRFDRRDSQDVWIFRAPLRDSLFSPIRSPQLRESPLPGAFFLGIPNCDNRIAWDIQAAGYKVSNPSKLIRGLHYHLVSVRTYEEKLEKEGYEKVRIPPPYKLVPPDRGGGLKSAATTKNMEGEPTRSAGSVEQKKRRKISVSLRKRLRRRTPRRNKK